MKVIAISAVTAGGKTTVVNKLRKKLPKAQSLHFDDYNFDGAVDNFYEWTKNGVNYNVWDLTPLAKDIRKLKENKECRYLLLDYPFAYCNDMIKEYIDYAVFIDTPLDIALARGILRDMKDSTGVEIRDYLMNYLNYARIAYIKMQRDISRSSDIIISGDDECRDIVDVIFEKVVNI